MSTLIYFSSTSENTHRFIRKLDLPSLRISLKMCENTKTDTPYILILPSYGGGSPQGAIPRQVIRFLNDPFNRSLLCGVISAGNRNFGAGFCLAGNIVAKKCQVPLLYRFELLGTPKDVKQVRKGVTEFWQKLNLL
ncbi:class Ib ribonucleoside-diphosphate reductase assembly flavoprotein NrdI [Candidatus Steffania adelgidicola]|uniref:class Ib ribonucleoside-diphosphate reductase assembly flavoprotein NrdI n=1 Tax=Candidatus Steffania adelgidicola TaxID=1076626 RepID=UPI001D01DDFD|nr:class Ib ribonucleoside-diphosphate reductase assembly flavoprotein NrdI [Candidatus Steffania adelgidicola]UDG79524.1 Protein NrdI [Candidatus Steffania adelgidicola]